MSEEFPNPCCRCGFCCLSENCEVVMLFYDIPKKGVRCPQLSFDGETAVCGLVKMMPPEKMVEFGIGVGCCMLARCYREGVEYDFASLSPEEKRFIVAHLQGEPSLTS